MSLVRGQTAQGGQEEVLTLLLDALASAAFPMQRGDADNPNALSGVMLNYKL